MENLTDYGVKRLALILSVQAEIEAMKAENKEREERGESLAYGDADFRGKAIELKELAYKHDYQL